MDGEARIAGWTIFGVLCAFKLLTAVLIFSMMPSAGSALLLLVFHWFWLIPLIVLGAGALIGWLRLVRVRARRARLLRAEFSAD
jgi:hypothetical protein